MRDNDLPLHFDSPQHEALIDNTLEFTSKVAGTEMMYVGKEHKNKKQRSIIKEFDAYFSKEKRVEIIHDHILPQMPEGIWGLNEFKIIEKV